MPAKSRRPEPEFDEDNPEWKEEDFARARPPHEVLAPEVLSAFRTTRGPQKIPRKIPVSSRLSAEVVEHFKATGPGWQGRIDATLKEVVATGGKHRGRN
jgi:uncharacterized protein (DUF4415 family)